MAQFNLEDYAPVDERIASFYKDFPDGSIRTRMARLDGPEVFFEARVFRSPADVAGNVYTSGWAREVEGKSPVNKTSHIENAETSSIGRALANLGYTTNAHRASRSEMLKVHRVNKEHAEMLDWIRGIGAAVLEDQQITVAGATHNAKTYIRESWPAIKEQFRVARGVVDALESSTGEKFTAST
jgi:hypothetical protein